MTQGLQGSCVPQVTFREVRNSSSGCSGSCRDNLPCPARLSRATQHGQVFALSACTRTSGHALGADGLPLLLGPVVQHHLRRSQQQWSTTGHQVCVMFIVH